MPAYDALNKSALPAFQADARSATDDAFRDAVEVVAMDGFTGFKTAAAEEIPDAVTVMDPFHVVRLAGDALDRCRRRVQLAIHGHRGFRDDPLYKSRRTLHTGADLLTDKQSDRLRALFVDDAHVEVEATWGVYQRMIAAYRHEDRQRGRELMEKLITDRTTGILGVHVWGRECNIDALTEIAQRHVGPVRLLIPEKRFLLINNNDIHEHEEVEESLNIVDKEKELIVKALKKHRGKRKDAALDLGISERTLYRKLKEYDIDQ